MCETGSFPVDLLPEGQRPEVIRREISRQDTNCTSVKKIFDNFIFFFLQFDVIFQEVFCYLLVDVAPPYRVLSCAFYAIKLWTQNEKWKFCSVQTGFPKKSSPKSEI